MTSLPRISVPQGAILNLKSERGASMVEYALLVILIAIVAFVAVAFAGEELSSTYTDISDSLAAANAGS